MEKTWELLERTIRITGRRTPCSAKQCELCAKQMSLELPSSYCEYAKRFGLGEWEQDLVTYVPVEPTYNPLFDPSIVSYAESQRSVIDLWISDDKRRRQMKTPERVERLVAFARWTSGFSLNWDTGSKQKNGEMDLYLANYPETCEYCGSNILEFLLDYWIGGKINQVYRFSNNEKWGTSNRFNPWP
jgi:hypothetical protein